MKDITGQKFGRLTAQWPVGRNKQSQICWLCICECGILSVVPKCHLYGHTQSCGCRVNHITHGHCKNGPSPEYRSYRHAKSRCTNPKEKWYLDYGGRGIEFRFSNFEEFLSELGEKPEPKQKYSLDRINPNGHYEKGNVRWTTAKTQTSNRRKYAAINKFTTDELLKELHRRGIK